MAFNAGFTKYQKKKWLDALAAIGTMRIAIYSTTTALDAFQDPASPLVYSSTGELTGSGTGYNNTGVAGTTGYALSGATVSANGNGYQLSWNDVITGSGTIAAGTYGAMIYDTADSNRVAAVLSVTVSTGSSSGTMTFDIPANALTVS